jgi:hypothetical protein
MGIAVVGGAEFAGQFCQDGFARFAERADALFGIVGERLVRGFKDEVALDTVAVAVSVSATAGTIGVGVGGDSAGVMVDAIVVRLGIGVLMAGDDADGVAVRIYSGASGAGGAGTAIVVA